MKIVITLVFCFSFITCNNPQDNSNPRLVGGHCEGCESVFEYGDKELSSVDTLPDFNENGPKLKVTGRIFKADGMTPAKDVLLYIYHTDQNGIYPKKGDETGWAKRHGYLRGWIKTDEDGNYSFFTLRPASYPNGSAPAHIHGIILEPNGKYYWIEDYFFDDDLLLNKNEISNGSTRGGNSGILSLRKEGEIWIGKRDIVLGKNIPNYE
jgi:protocatechuate 3,4-dioxygenase, beta subunit